MVVIPLIGKFAGAFIGAFVARLDMPFALATGLMAKGVAEMALLLVLFELDVIGPAVFSLLVLIMLAYILFTPLAIRAVVNRVGSSAQATLPESLPPSLTRFALDDITVGDILDRTRTYPDPAMSVRAFADQWIVPHQQDYPGVEQGELYGIVSVSMLRYLPKESWSKTPLRKLARRRTAARVARRTGGRRAAANDGKLVDGDSGEGPGIQKVSGRGQHQADPGTDHPRSRRRILTPRTSRLKTALKCSVYTPTQSVTSRHLRIAVLACRPLLPA